jgi:phosphatidylserine/phosphatidylglycerophosphate/cardiolipin synthase-like enzyme
VPYFEIFVDNIQDEIYKRLNAATQSICIAMAYFTDIGVIELLQRKAKEGLTIEILTHYEDVISAPLMKIKNNIGKIYFIKYGGKKKMHLKICVIDSKVAINGSYNFTNQARENDESIAIFDESLEVQKLIGKFNKLKKSFEKEVLPKLASRLKIITGMLELEENGDALRVQVEKLNQHISVPQIVELTNLLNMGKYKEAMSFAQSMKTLIESGFVVKEAERVDYAAQLMEKWKDREKWQAKLATIKAVASTVA